MDDKELHNLISTHVYQMNEALMKSEEIDGYEVYVRCEAILCLLDQMAGDFDSSQDAIIEEGNQYIAEHEAVYGGH